MPKIPLGMCSWHAEYTNRPQEYCIAAEFQIFYNVLKNPYSRQSYFRCRVIISMQYAKMNGRVDCSMYYSRGCDLSTSALSLTPTRYNGRCKSWRRANANQFAEADVVAPSELQQILGRELSSPACFGFGPCPGGDFFTRPRTCAHAEAPGRVNF